MSDHGFMLLILVVLVILLGWAVRKYYLLYDKWWIINKMLDQRIRKIRWLEAELREEKMFNKPKPPLQS